MDTLVISRCNRFTVRIQHVEVGFCGWYVMQTGKRYKVLINAIKNAKSYIKVNRQKYPQLGVIRKRRLKENHQVQRKRLIPTVKKNRWVQIHYYDIKF